MYLQGIVIEKEQNIIRGLKRIYGIGNKKAEHICNQCQIHYKTKISELDNLQQRRLQNLVAKMKVGQVLDKEMLSNIFKQINNKTHKGYKHLVALPVRGQRTKTNAKTRTKYNNKIVKIAGREYFKEINKEQYINKITNRITSTSHEQYKNRKKHKKNKK